MTLPPVSLTVAPVLLIVDDDAYILRALQTILTQELRLPEGSICACGTVSSAMAAFDRHRETIRAVVTDMRLPLGVEISDEWADQMIQGGSMVHDYVRKSPSDIPIAIMSSAWWSELRERIDEDPKSKFFLKPVTAKYIAAWIQGAWTVHQP